MSFIKVNDIKYNTAVFSKVVKDESKLDLIYVAPSGKKVIMPYATLEELESAYEQARIGGGSGEQPTETLEVTSNGTYNVLNFATVKVNIPVPTGNIEITENGNYNVSQYATASVNVEYDIVTDMYNYDNSLFTYNARVPLSDDDYSEYEAAETQEILDSVFEEGE